MWIEYPIFVNFEKQKQIIQQLRNWIQNLEEKGLVLGLASNHCFNNPNEPDSLRIRFEYETEDNQRLFETELQNEVRVLVNDYTLEHRV